MGLVHLILLGYIYFFFAMKLLSKNYFSTLPLAWTNLIVQSNRINIVYSNRSSKKEYVECLWLNSSLQI